MFRVKSGGGIFRREPTPVQQRSAQRGGCRGGGGSECGFVQPLCRYLQRRRIHVRVASRPGRHEGLLPVQPEGPGRAPRRGLRPRHGRPRRDRRGRRRLQGGRQPRHRRHRPGHRRLRPGPMHLQDGVQGLAPSVAGQRGQPVLAQGPSSGGLVAAGSLGLLHGRQDGAARGEELPRRPHQSVGGFARRQGVRRRRGALSAPDGGQGLVQLAPGGHEGPV
mmetsp:Transcript_5390/g.10990  ORF Transcript_5390/g.10990 Transcript_5390/m.10990 type:complete len:220 (-) Transcript_5390:754-1413(-)